MKSGSTSPIKDPPLRLPGQSLVEERARIWDDKVDPWALMAVFMIALAALEWVSFYRNDRFNAWLFSAVAAVALAIAVWKLCRQRPRMRQLRQAIEGEKAVGRFLDRLRERGYSVFHDVLGANFNIDHVLVGPGGVFTVETKTWSKPARVTRGSPSMANAFRQVRTCPIETRSCRRGRR